MSTAPTRFRARPVVVEAIRYHPGPDGNCEAVAAFIGEDIDHEDADCDPETEWVISTLEGEATALPGDWIVRGVGGYFYPCRPDIFEATYDPEAA